jgi:hypothetical protein
MKSGSSGVLLGKCWTWQSQFGYEGIGDFDSKFEVLQLVLSICCVCCTIWMTAKFKVEISLSPSTTSQMSCAHKRTGHRSRNYDRVTACARGAYIRTLACTRNGLCSRTKALRPRCSSFPFTFYLVSRRIHSCPCPYAIRTTATFSVLP